MFTVKIKPKQYFYENNKPKVNELFVRINSIIPNQEAEFIVDFRNDELGSLYQQSIKMDGDDYHNWGNDDNYLIDWIIAKVKCEKE